MIKIGIIGVGHLGKIHISCLQQIEEIELVGFYDTNPTTIKEVVDKYHIPYYDTYQSLIAACDAIDIVTPTISHYQLAMQAMNFGKHVFLEKPITATISEAEEVVKYAQEHRLKVQVGHVERFNDAYLNAKPFFKTPLFVEAHRLAEFNPRGTDVSVVLDLMIHDIDIVLSLIPYSVVEVSANGVAVVSHSPDIANARLTFSNGATANLTASRIAMKKMRKMRLFQPNAYITMDFVEKKADIMHLRDYQPSDDNDLFPLIVDLGENKGKKRIFIESPVSQNVNAIKMELSLFAKSIATDIPCVVSAEDGSKALQIAYRIMESMEEQARIVKQYLDK